MAATMTAASLNGHQKIALLCMSLGPEAAAEITRQLPHAAVEKVTAEIARMGSVDPGLVDQVLAEWDQAASSNSVGGGTGYARQVLERAFGARKAGQLLERVGGEGPERPRLTVFQGAEPKQISRMLAQEHPQTVALALSQLDATQTAEILETLGIDPSSEVLHRMAAMQPVAPEILEIIASALEAGSELYLAGAAMNPAGPDSVAAVLNRLPARKDQLLAGLGERDPDVLEQVRNLMFIFEDLVNVDKRSMQTLLQNVDTKDLALSLKVASEGVKKSIEGVMSQRALAALNSEIEFLGPVRVSEVEEAQRRVIGVARQLEQNGELMLNSGGDDQLV